MKTGKTPPVFLAVCTITALLAACSGGTPSVPIRVLWQPDGNGFVQFATNDAQDLAANDSGRQFVDSVHAFSTTSWSSSTTLTVTTERMSSASHYGYGILFCASPDLANYYRILIDLAGYYQVIQSVDGTLTALVTARKSANLVGGFAKQNTIAVSYDSGTQRFRIAFNGVQEATFAQSAGPNATSGTATFIVFIGPVNVEGFPVFPVDVRFKMTAPDTIP